MRSPGLVYSWTILILCFVSVGTVAGQGYETVHSFSFDHGGPGGGLMQEADGKLYGVTTSGGSYGKGSVIVLTPDGSGGYDLATLHEFTDLDGEEPHGPLVKGADGLFYGTTVWGGAQDLGTLFRIDTIGNFESLHSFAGGDGQNPVGALVQASDGNWYGTAGYGGSGGYGTAYRLDSAGIVTVLHSFVFTEGHPAGGLVQAGDGLLYGTAWDFGTSGTLYRMTLAGAVTVIHNFSGADGSDPIWPLLAASDGKLYGVASGGVAGGVVYRIDTTGNFALLHSMSIAQGISPGGPLVQGADGKLYGTALFGGVQDRGTLFRISTSGAFELLHACGASEPTHPSGRLLETGSGVFIGGYQVDAVPYGGLFVFEAPSDLSFLLALGPNDGAQPAAELRQATDGLLYGTTTGGGALGFGALFRMDLLGSVETLHTFSYTDGAYPASQLVQASDGHLYGTSGYSASNFGTTFRLGLDGAFTPLADFSTVQTDAPRLLIQATDGLLYGSVAAGIHRIGLDGHVELFVAPPPEKAFNHGLVQAADGWLYGTAVSQSSHSIFRVDLQGTLEEVYTFTGGADGALPFAGLLLGSDGNLYGTTIAGGTDGNGTVFRYDPLSGTFTALYSFGSAVSGDGSYTYGPLAEGADGSLYGTTINGGLYNWGTVFRVTPAGVGSVIHSFASGGDDGIAPQAGVILASDGLLYGTAAGGGEFGGGVVYRVDPDAALSVTSIAPTSGPAAGGTSVTIAGGVFLPGAVVSFGKVAALEATVLGDNEVEATTPALEPGTLHFGFVTNPDGASGSLSKAFLADFNDVPAGNLYHPSVESLIRAGVTAGCGFGFYCGNQPTTRAQMAVFLLKSKLGAGYLPPPATGTVFVDVPANAFAAAWIEDLAARGITVGCGSDLYCPNSQITRAQMAAFLLRALLGPGYVPPPAVGIFGDVAIGSFAADYIEDLHARGISAGCSASPLLYCPTGLTTRSQMAAFLVATFNLP